MKNKFLFTILFVFASLNIFAQKESEIFRLDGTEIKPMDLTWTIPKAYVGLGNVDNVQQMPLSYLSTDTTMVEYSNIKVPSQKAVVDYVTDHSGGGGTTILTAYKTADETVNNSATLQDDDHLTLTVERAT